MPKIDFKQLKKPAVQGTLKGNGAEDFVVAVAPCRYTKGELSGTETGNFECIIKTPKSRGEKEMRAAIETYTLENRPSNYDPNWGGCHFRIETKTQYDLIVLALQGLSYGSKLKCEEVPNAFTTKPAPILKLVYDAPNDWYTLAEKAYGLKFFTSAIGFKWLDLGVAQDPVRSPIAAALGAQAQEGASGPRSLPGSSKAHGLPLSSPSQAHARGRVLDAGAQSCEDPGCLDAQERGHDRLRGRAEGEPEGPLRHLRMGFCRHHHGVEPPADYSAYPIYSRATYAFFANLTCLVDDEAS